MTGGCHFSNLRHVCGDSFHALQCPGVSGVKMRVYGKSLQALLSLPRPPLSRLLSRASRTSTFHDIPKWRACSQAKTTSVRRFSALRASVWPKNEVVVVVVVGGGLPWIRHWVCEQSARNCATIQQVLILKFAFRPEKFPFGPFEKRGPNHRSQQSIPSLIGCLAAIG